MKNVLVILTLLVFFKINLAAAQQENSCKALLLGYVKQMANIKTPSPEKTYYMDMTIENLGAEKLKPSAMEVHVKVWLTADQLTYKSSEVDLYQDSVSAIAIMHSQKKIIVSDGKKSSKEETNRLNFGGIQEGFIERATVTMCRSITWEGRETRLIDLELHKDDQKQFKIKFLTIYYDEVEQRLFKVAISYQKEQPLIRQTITYNKLDFNSKKGKQKQVLENIMDKNGRILPMYARYTFIDNRR